MNTKPLKFPAFDPRVRRKFKRAQRKIIRQLSRTTHLERTAKYVHTYLRSIERRLPTKMPGNVRAAWERIFPRPAYFDGR